MSYWVYIMASKRNGTLYTGMTNHITRRVFEHKQRLNPYSFTSKYSTYILVYAEKTENVQDAILREKVLKKWQRIWKIALIEKNNPEWHDLYEIL